MQKRGPATAVTVLLRYQHTAIHAHLAGELVLARLRRRDDHIQGLAYR